MSMCISVTFYLCVANYIFLVKGTARRRLQRLHMPHSHLITRIKSYLSLVIQLYYFDTIPGGHISNKSHFMSCIALDLYLKLYWCILVSLWPYGKRTKMSKVIAMQRAAAGSSQAGGSAPQKPNRTRGTGLSFWASSALEGQGH